MAGIEQTIQYVSCNHALWEEKLGDSTTPHHLFVPHLIILAKLTSSFLSLPLPFLPFLLACQTPASQ